MQRLSAVDALFVETETKRMNQHVVAVLILDPSGIQGGYSFAAIRDHFASRLDQIPAYRRRLVHVPFRLGLPLWVDDPDFDLDAHIHRRALAAPGGDTELAQFVAGIAGRSLDRDRPLWETWVVEGLAGGRIAVVAKTHHALMDGVTGAALISKLFDLDQVPPERRPEVLWAPPLLPSSARLVFEALPAAVLRPASLVRTSIDATRGVLGVVRNVLARPTDSTSPALPFSAPETPFNQAICSQRTVAYGRASLIDIKRIKDTFGCTVNDVVLTACALSLQEWLRDHGGLPDRPLIATLPVSVHESDRVSGNKVSTMFVRLPTNEPDPVLALQALQEDVVAAKDLHRALGSETIMELAEFAPRLLLNLGAKLYSGWNLAGHHRPVYNVIISNVPGPTMPLYMNGAELLAFYPHGPIFEGAGLNLTVMSYQDSVDIGIIGCRDSVQDADQLATGFVHAIERLHAAALRRTPAGEQSPADSSTSSSTA